MNVRFTSIEIRDNWTHFTLQAENGDRASFRHQDFEAFVKRAASLVRPPVVLTDTDQLLGIWFWLDEPDDSPF